MRTRPGILALVAIAFALPLAAADSSLGSFRDWSAVRFGGGKDLACMAFSQPVKSEGDYSSRGDAFVFVTHRPAAAERNRISLDTGYTYKTGSLVEVAVGDLKIDLPTTGSTAWLDDKGDATRLVDAMRAGSALVVTGTSSRGTTTVDHYSLYGFSAAHAAIDKACRG